MNRLRDARIAVAAAAAWSVFDALVHVAVDMVEPLRIMGNVVGVAAAATVWAALRHRPKPAAVVSGLAAGAILGLNVAWLMTDGALRVPSFVFITVAVGLFVWATWQFLSEVGRASSATSVPRMWSAGAIVTGLVAVVAGVAYGFLSTPIRQLHDDRLVDADYWRDELVILSAGMGFDNIIGVPDDDLETVREALGSYAANPDCVDDDDPLVTTQTSGGLGLFIRGFADYDDGLPIVMSWPVLTSTMHPEDFLFTLNDGSQVMPNSVTMVPNWELNERNTLVMFGDFGNRGVGDEPGTLFPVKLELVDDGTPLMFVGPGGQVKSGVGLTWETDTSPYESGPKLVGAKLNRIGDEPSPGEGGVSLLERIILPNDEHALYGGGDFKIRILTTGGFSPDGMTGVTPDQYSDFFRIHATGPDGETVLMTDTGVDYELDGGTLRVVGLSDLGKPAGDGVHYDDCYAEDSDNYIDIILEGDEAAARGLTHLEIPAGEDGYLSFYNPGGPGLEPFPDVRYTAPGPPDLEPIIHALDDPMRVSYEP